MNYSRLLDFDNNAVDTMVLRDDGVFVLTDASATDADAVAYRDWLAAGNAPGEAIRPPPPVPSSISDRQFFQQLAVVDIITEEQAMAANAAVIPPPLLALIEQMPEEQQFSAKMIVSGATMFERSHPMTVAIGTAYGMSSEQIDEFFRAAAAL